MNLLFLAISAVLAYLIGSIPVAYIFGRVLKGIDIREHGSGNMGATNAFRGESVGKGLRSKLGTDCAGVDQAFL